jgi:hypothetical protein
MVRRGSTGSNREHEWVERDEDRDVMTARDVFDRVVRLVVSSRRIRNKQTDERQDARDINGNLLGVAPPAAAATAYPH